MYSWRYVSTKFRISNENLTLLKTRISDIIHLSAVVHHTKSYSELRQVNVIGMQDVLKVALSSGARFCYVSSFVAGVDKNTDGHYTESVSHVHPPRYFNGYTLSKWCCESLIKDACEHGLQAIILRPGNITGQRRTGISNYENNHELLLLAGLVQMGHAPRWKGIIEMTPVDFLAELIVLIQLKIKNEEGTVYNLDNPNSMKWVDFIHLIKDLGKFQIELIEPETWKKDYLINISKENKFSPLAFMYLGSGGETHERQYIHYNTKWACNQLGLEYPTNYPELIKIYLKFLNQMDFFVLHNK